MFSNSFFVIEAIVAFGFLIFVHELGHFLACKWIKVRVDVFSLGFGPALKKFKRGETEYRLCVVPLGGYVKMAGEEPTPEKPPAADEFYGKTVGQRAFVFVAGVVMNMIFGFLFFIAAYRIGVDIVPAEVGGVQPGSPAWKQGLRAGDRIVTIGDSERAVDYEDLKTVTMLTRPGRPIRMKIQRGNETFPAVLYPEYNPDIGLQVVGIYAPSRMTMAPLTEEEWQEGFGRAYQAGLRSGDLLVAIEAAGQPAPIPLETMQDYDEAIEECAGRPVTLIVMRDGKEERITATPEAVGEARWIGVKFGSTQVSAVRNWAQSAGIQAGDEMTEVDGKPVACASDVRKAIADAAGGTLSLNFTRAGKSQSVTVLLPKGAEDDIAFEGSNVVDGCLPGFPAEQAGLQPGDRIVSVNDKSVSSQAEISQEIVGAKGGAVTLGWLHNGEARTAQVIPQKPWALDVPFHIMPTETLQTGLVDATVLGARKSFQWVTRVYASLRQLIIGKVSVKLLSGPVSIARLTYVAAKRGPGMLFYIIGVLSVNLAVMNLLPIPVLDGGHLVFAGIEKLRGKPVHEKVRTAATYVGISLLVALIVVAFWNDIANWIMG